MEIYTTQRPSLLLAPACAPSASWLPSTASAVLTTPRPTPAPRVHQVQIQAELAQAQGIILETRVAVLVPVFAGSAIDPVDDSTFWFTTEYLGTPNNSSFSWSTRIVAFKVGK